VKRVFLGKNFIETKTINTDKNESESFYKKHLLMTKAELTKCLGTILEQPNKVEQKKQVSESEKTQTKTKRNEIFFSRQNNL
jgi:hypothetical protein